MIRLKDIRLPLHYEDTPLTVFAAKALKTTAEQIQSCVLVKRAVDARNRNDVHFTATLDVTMKGNEAAAVKRAHPGTAAIYTPHPFVFPQKNRLTARPVIVGSGPAGLFAALTLARAGAKPLVIERGAPVHERIQAVRQMMQTGVLNGDANIQFGEGGAGTFSDGKLYTGINDPRCRAVLEIFASAGDAPDILWQARPHLGTDRLCRILLNLKAEILSLGGEIRFYSKLTGIVRNGRALTAVRVVSKTGSGEEEREIPCSVCILAIGHSARDTVRMLADSGIKIRQKPFAVGVRIEHPRKMIDRIRYGKFAGNSALSAADYKLSCHLPNDRGVFTFCMCPGGTVIPAASQDKTVVTNGMSTFARGGENSNSALLCGIGPDDLESDHPLAGIEFQEKMEAAAFSLGGGGFRTPVQLVGDFLLGKPSTHMGDIVPSYRPSVTPSDLRLCLPESVSASLAAALTIFGRKMKGFDRYDAVLTGVESRSSSPVRFPRDEYGCSSVKGLFPCGEGSGYAGGIMSAAADGIRCAETVLELGESGIARLP